MRSWPHDLVGYPSDGTPLELAEGNRPQHVLVGARHRRGNAARGPSGTL
jgi:hypothetical protein